MDFKKEGNVNLFIKWLCLLFFCYCAGDLLGFYERSHLFRLSLFSFVTLYGFRSMRAVLPGANPTGRQSGVAGQGQHTPSGLRVVFSCHIYRRVHGRGRKDKNAEPLAGVEWETADSAGRRRTGQHTQKGTGNQRRVCGRVAAAR